MPRNGGLSVDEAKAIILAKIGQGLKVEDACKAAGRSRKTYENYRASDAEWTRKVDEARDRFERAKAGGRDESAANIGFEEWRKRFLGRDTYPHQRMWIDVLEGRDPEDLHPSVRYERGNPLRLLINTPPYHSKSTVVTTEYVVYRICMNPNVRVKVVSKTREFAQSLLYSIKQMLTNPAYSELQAAYAPVGKDGIPSFKGSEGAWTAFAIYVAGKGADAADAAAKDPTVQALGIGGQIYGTRADLIIVDDAITLDNASNHEKQIVWLRKEVGSRVKNGKIIVVGTRVASIDLYSELRNPDNFSGGKSNWTYLAQPAVLEFADKPEDYVTLWPRSTQAMDEEDPGEPDENGTYPAWDGPALEEVRSGLDEKSWALVYQQAEIAEDTVFHPKCVNGSVNGQRKPGPLIAGAFGHPKRGAEGMHVIGSIDPAGTGEAFILLYAVDRATKHRYVLNCFMANHTTPAWYAQQIAALTPQYGVKEWVIEQNAYASWIINDQTIMQYCRERGIPIASHYTSRNKQDPDFGVASMASLFGSLRKIQEGGREEHNKDNIIWLPDKHSNAGVQALVSQLVAWQPGKLGRQLRQDGPMALWFAELRARNYIGEGAQRQQTHVRTSFLTQAQRNRQAVIPAGYFSEG